MCCSGDSDIQVGCQAHRAGGEQARSTINTTSRPGVQPLRRKYRLRCSSASSSTQALRFDISTYFLDAVFDIDPLDSGYMPP
ncbi:hypothetical protein VTO73DRAFT_11784 [Trametes versicolor]